jgi:hypothetical protein
VQRISIPSGLSFSVYLQSGSPALVARSVNMLTSHATLLQKCHEARTVHATDEYLGEKMKTQMYIHHTHWPRQQGLAASSTLGTVNVRYVRNNYYTLGNRHSSLQLVYLYAKQQYYMSCLLVPLPMHPCSPCICQSPHAYALISSTSTILRTSLRTSRIWQGTSPAWPPHIHYDGVLHQIKRWHRV